MARLTDLVSHKPLTPFDFDYVEHYSPWLELSGF